ncbi:MAG: DEAD/DEAH box helicase [Anaerolineales bacterium]|nr:DEAD/DEAH box helicase [Anaerolineales bacterium]
MKPDVRSRRVLSITQSKAKMYEYSVPLDQHIALTADPSRLFPLTIGMLGDISAKINVGEATAADIQELRDSLPFSARFFDAFVETRLNQENDPYIQLLGSAAYYLCNLSGSSNILADRIQNPEINFETQGLEKLLLWLLLIKDFPATFPDVLDSIYKGTIDAIRALLLQFNETGSQMAAALDAARQLRNIAYELGTPKELLLADLIGAIIRKRFDNSTWNCLPKYTDLPIETWAEVIKKKTFIKEFWSAQHLLGEKGVFKGKSAVVQMPTSAGKTKATEVIIRSAFLSKRTTLAVIITPFRALCHEIRQGLITAFQGEDIFVDELSDVLQMDLSIERILQFQQVLVATPEKFNYVVRHASELAPKIGLIIYDEGHQFDNGTRGITYELLLTSLKARILDTTQIVLISAVISNASQIGQWLIGDDAEPVIGLNLAPTFRSVGFSTRIDPRRNLYFVNHLNPDEWEYFVPRIIDQYQIDEETIFPNVNVGREVALYLGLRLTNQGTIAVFCGRKLDVTGMCKLITDIFEKGLPMQPPLEFSNKVEIQKLKFLHDGNLGEDAIMSKSAELGVFAHHNNVPHGIRLAIEYAVKKEDAKFVICTSTLAQGVNLPIRYLIVSRVDQGGERILVRDFQNLIGRSGRSGMHTEGSILFADSRIYDERNSNDYTKERWQTVKELLDPSKSEKCESKLYSIFNPLHGTTPESPYNNIVNFVQAYTAGALSEIAQVVQQQNTDNEAFNLDALQREIDSKVNIISAIESYLMSNWDSTQNILDRDEVRNLAIGTLAYFLAVDDEQKKQIEDLFILLAQNIETNIPDVSKRLIFGKTLYGVPASVAISAWLDEHGTELSASQNETEIFEVIWGLLESNIHNNQFRKCDKPESMKKVAFEWCHGIPFNELLEIIKQDDARRRAKSRRIRYTLEDVVDVCENGFAYDGILVLGAVIELVPTLAIDNSDIVVNSLQEFQKRLKYGLPSQIAVVLYELGFADRVVAIELSSIFQEVEGNKDIVLQALKARREEAFIVLDKYPAYFRQVYANVAT